jgi:hypothetical protein
VDWVTDYYDSVVGDIDPHRMGETRVGYWHFTEEYRSHGRRAGMEGWEFLSHFNDLVHDYASHL